MYSDYEYYNSNQGNYAYRKPPLHRLAVNSAGCKPRAVFNFRSSSVAIEFIEKFYFIEKLSYASQIITDDDAESVGTSDVKSQEYSYVGG